MCNRYAFYTAPQKLKDVFGTDNLADFAPRYNAAPLQSLPVIVRNRTGLARWGFLPPWAQQDDEGLAAKLTNARSETVFEKATFREAWAKGRRCLIPVNGFYEWDQGRQPYYFHAADDTLTALAGLWTKCGDRVMFTVLTKDADGPLADIHHRAPVMIAPDRAAEWFAADEQAARRMMAQSTASNLLFHAVGREVERIANDNPALIVPVRPPRQEALAL